MVDYELFAFIGPAKALGKWASEATWARPAVIRHGLALVPLADDMPLDGLADWGRARSFQTPVALLQAECFGGVGAERGWLWTNGALQMEEAPAVELLRALGVKAAPDEDERVLAGLLAHPTTQDWMAHVDLDRCLEGVPPVRGLVAALQYQGDRDAQVRTQAAERLGRLGRVARPALPALQAVLRADPRPSVVLGCACAMARIGAEGIPMLHGALDLPDTPWAVVYALGEAGAEARATAPSLRRLLRNDTRAEVRAACAEVLGRIAADESADVLVTALNDPDRRVRTRAAEALGRGYDLYRAHLEALQTAATDADPYVRGAATDALHRLESRFQTS